MNYPHDPLITDHTDHTPAQPSEASKIRPLIGLILGTVLVLILVIVISREMEDVREFISQSGWIGVLVSIAVYGLLGASPVPSEPLTVLLSTLYGPFTATITAGVGNLLAALMEYYIGERIGDVASFENRREKLPFGLGKLPVDSAAFLLIARMLPGYGPKFVSVISGVYRVPIWRYVWTAAIPTFIGAAIFAYGGFGILHAVLPGIYK